MQVVRYQERKTLDYTYGLLARALFAILSSPSGDTRRYNSVGVGWTGIRKYGVECPDIVRELPLPGATRQKWEVEYGVLGKPSSAEGHGLGDIHRSRRLVE